MNFSDKLNVLMETFNITGKHLAKAMHVDPSLISKWQNGKRLPSKKSKYIPGIADFFASTEILEYQKMKILDTIRLSVPFSETDANENLKEVFAQWLTMQEGNVDSSNIATTNSQVSIDNIISSIRSFPTLMTKASGSTFNQNEFKMNTLPGEACKIDLYKGRAGKRHAIATMVNMVLDSKEPLEILVTSQEDMTWIIEDSQYLNEWTKSIKEILFRGHSFTMLHNLDRELNHILSILNQWTVLHLTGRLKSYYFERYRENKLKMTMFIIKGVTAALSMSSTKDSDENCTFIFYDHASVKMLESNYYELLEDCKPIVNAFFKQKIRDLDTAISDFDEKPGYYYALNEGLSAHTIPLELYSKLLSRLEINEDDKKMRLMLHKRRLEAFEKNIKKYIYREICPLEIIDDLINKNMTMYPGIFFFTENPVVVETNDIIDHLKHIVSILKNYDNYELALTGKFDFITSNRMGVAYKEHVYFIVSTWEREGTNPIVLTTDEGTILLAVEEYFANIWELIPRVNRSKEWVIKKLQDRINSYKA